MSPDSSRCVLLGRHCVALVLRGASREEVGRPLFRDFLRQNWVLVRTGLEYGGCLAPCTLLLRGTRIALEGVRSAWARRVLRPPRGYRIAQLGDVSGPTEMVPVSQAPFAPLPEALCQVVWDLNGEEGPATPRAIRLRLREGFPDLRQPGEDVLHEALGSLVRDRKIYHNGRGYLVVRPDTYRRRTATSPANERPMLMTNEEAIVRLHGDIQEPSSSAIDERPAAQIEDYYLEANKGEKTSVLAKILRRMQFLKSTKHVVFSGQFPPLDRCNGAHSVATQTTAVLQNVCGGSKWWEETQNDKDPPLPLHFFGGPNIGESPDRTRTRRAKYSHQRMFANYSRRRHRYRKSSSGSQKTFVNESNRSSSSATQKDRDPSSSAASDKAQTTKIVNVQQNSDEEGTNQKEVVPPPPPPDSLKAGESLVRPLLLKSFVDVPPPKEICVDNSVSVEVAVDKIPPLKSNSNNVSTTVVTEETTVTKANGNSKVVTVTSITTNVQRGPLEKNDLNTPMEKEGARVHDTCNIATELQK